MDRLLNVRIISFFVSLILSIGLVGFIFLQNIAPFGITVHYDLQSKSEYISKLNPTYRVKEEIENGKTIYKQIEDLIYFSTDMPFHFDTATVRLKIKNEIPNQALRVGFKDRFDWHYAAKTVDLPLLSLSEWHTIGGDPVLYQKKKMYNSINEFISNPPKEALIGIYDYDINKLITPTIKGYKPQERETVIETPIRGRVIFYTYVENEPFFMKITKQDLNWYAENDPVTIAVYKGGTRVYETIIEDDGIIDNSKKTSKEQTVTIKNPGPGLPENGVYKVVISANQDTIIKRINTNLHKIIFESPLFLAGNANAYPHVIQKTRPTILYTDALLLNVQTYHSEGIQRIETPKKKLQLKDINLDGQIIPEQDITPVTIPKNDVIIRSFGGYFIFDQSHYFQPTPYRTIQITQETDLELVDYILTSKKPAIQDGEWRIVEQTYDLSDAVIENGKLSWLIQAPKLKDNKEKITIENIEVILHKKPKITL